MLQQDSEAKEVGKAAGISRRAFLVGSGGFVSLFALGGMAYGLQGSSPSPLRPPSAQDEARFHATCLKCDRCRSICPENCIRTGLIEDGVLNYRTPIMDFHRGGCTFCGKCVTVCPTTTITRTDEELDCIGIAEVDKERCIAWLLGSCRVCVDACPYEAIFLDEAGRPIVDEEACNGCGFCEYKCPSNSYRSFSGGTKRGINIVRSETE